MAAPASKWTPDYLQSVIGNRRVSVLASRDHNFLFHNAKMVNKDSGDAPLTKRTTMKFADFIRRLREWKPGDDR